MSTGAVSTHPWLSACRPFFTAFNGQGDVGRDEVKARVERAAHSGCDVLVCFVESEGEALWPSAHLRLSALCRDSTDLVEALRSECASAGLRFVAGWMGVHCQSTLMSSHPSWLQRSYSGTTIAAMCLNSPFGDLLRAAVVEVVSRYCPDGVYFDGLYARRGGCYCEACSRARHALLLGEPEPPPGWAAPTLLGPRSHWLSFAGSSFTTRDLDQFRRYTVESYLASLRTSLDDAGQRPAVVIDTLGVRHAYNEMGHDLVRLSRDLDAVLLEAYWDNRREPIEHIGMEVELVRAETGLPVWWPRWLARHPDGIQVSMPAATVEAWAAQCAVHAASPVPAEQGLYYFDDSLEELVASSMRSVGQLQSAMTGTVKLADVALVHCPSTRARLIAEGQSEDEYFQSFCGAYLAMSEAHVSIDVLSSDNLSTEDLTRYKAVILPGARYLPASSASAIAEFVRRGGGLVASYFAGRESPLASAPQSALADLLGFELSRISVRDGRPGPERWGASVPATYCQVTDDAEILGEGLIGRRFAFAGPYIVCRPLAGDSVLATGIEPDFKVMDGERFFTWQPGISGPPLGFAGLRDLGRVVYWACPLDAVFMREGDPTVLELLVASASWASGATLVRPNLPGSVDVACYAEQGATENRVMVVVANRTCNARYGLGMAGERIDSEASPINHPVRYLIDVADLAIEIERESDSRAEQVLGELPSGWQLSGEPGEPLHLTLSSLHALERVQVRWPTMAREV